MRLPNLRENRTAAPTVSVIIPTYNRGSLVTTAVESVLNQTFTDFEIIVIDDGSTDDTRDRLRPYLEEIQYIFQPNRGASSAQNAGLVAARGEWIAILASDDAWHPTKLHRQLHALNALGPEFGACFTDCKYVGDSTMTATVFEEAGIQPVAEFGPLLDPLRYVWESGYGLWVQSMLARRSLVQESGGFDEELIVNEDRDLVFKLSFRTQFCYVSATLVSIDRSPATTRLCRIDPMRDREVFIWHELSLKKMLALPELQEPWVRQRIRQELEMLYYNQATKGVREFAPRLTMDAVRKIHSLDQSYPFIASALVARAARSLLRRSGTANQNSQRGFRRG